MNIEISGGEKDRLEFSDIDRAVLERGDGEIEIHHTEEGFQLFQNPNKQLETCLD